MNKLLMITACCLCLGMVGCASIGEAGDPCTNDSDCGEGTDCFNRAGGDSICMTLCAADDRLCEGGEVCLERSGGGTPVCYAGGTVELGATCTGGTECVRGGVCINSGTETSCFQACSTDDADPPCGAGETCQASSTTSTDGYCAAP